ncbi:hypothetical protein LNQ03_09230 [Klebsiella pneumoniae subsp. pneumoniae]|nr:hypothetical protein [Klebsiella pneumoniae subsp. pneumoniae]
MAGPVAPPCWQHQPFSTSGRKLNKPEREALRFADSLDKVNASMKAMNNTPAQGTIKPMLTSSY